MNISWSYRITFLYLGFVGIIVSLVVISSRNGEELVAKDYYAQELKYQDRLDAIANEKGLTQSISHSVSGEGITLTLPEGLTKVTGEVYLFCPSDSKKDIRFPLEFDASGKQIIKRSGIIPGAYKMKLSWNDGTKDYFREEVIVIK
jgi:hypothetical protein